MKLFKNTSSLDSTLHYFEVAGVKRQEPDTRKKSGAIYTDIMRKKLSHGSTKKRNVRTEPDAAQGGVETPALQVDSLDDEDQGFGGWLKSPDGLGTMKLFVIANSIVMLTTLVYPHLQAAFEIIYDAVYGAHALY